MRPSEGVKVGNFRIYPPPLRRHFLTFFSSTFFFREQLGPATYVLNFGWIRSKMHPLGRSKVLHKTGSCGKAEQKFNKNCRSKFFFSIADKPAKFQPNRITGKFSGSLLFVPWGFFSWRPPPRYLKIFLPEFKMPRRAWGPLPRCRISKRSNKNCGR
jgi:hypothetical protein